MPLEVFRMALPNGAYRYFVDGAETDRQTWAETRVLIETGDVDRRYRQITEAYERLSETVDGEAYERLGETIERLGEDLAQLRAKLLDVFAESE
jgi:hypothetical protein